MKIGITCYPTYGGSGVVATELGKVRGSPFFGPKNDLFKVDRSLFEKLGVVVVPLSSGLW